MQIKCKIISVINHALRFWVDIGLTTTTKQIKYRIRDQCVLMCDAFDVFHFRIYLFSLSFFGHESRKECRRRWRLRFDKCVRTRRVRLLGDCIILCRLVRKTTIYRKISATMTTTASRQLFPWASVPGRIEIVLRGKHDTGCLTRLGAVDFHHFDKLHTNSWCAKATFNSSFFLHLLQIEVHFQVNWIGKRDEMKTVGISHLLFVIVVVSVDFFSHIKMKKKKNIHLHKKF